MKYELSITRSFKTDYKKLNSEETEVTDEVIKQLLEGKILDEKYRDHALHGNYIGYRECHVKNDLLLVYKKDEENPAVPAKILILTCLRISSHSNIFGIKRRQK